MRNAEGRVNKYHFLRRFFIFAILFICATGCSQPLRTLIELGKEKQAQENYVARSRARFKLMLGDIKKGRLKIGTARTRVISLYGKPVLEDGGTLLYRDPVDFLHSAKVYLIFNEDAVLTGIRTEEGQKST